MKPEFLPEFRQRQGCSEQFHIRSRNEVAVRVLLVKRLDALRIDNQQSPLPFASGPGSKQSLRTLRKFRRGSFRDSAMPL
ncbi:MAG: hypothetical protein AUH86_03395 [Acidobacteria bacterium 13_1_40CM_4_58_4]|nr:MAG: hypothetical protein AUH86_03395 [Acidobacteria bacterium 13_1_40CM_4_58_4]